MNTTTHKKNILEIDTFLDNAPNSENMDWSFDKPNVPHTVVYIFNRVKEQWKVANACCSDIEYFATLEEAKQYCDRYRQSHDLDYGYIMRMEGDKEVGHWNEYWEDWEEEK